MDRNSANILEIDDLKVSFQNRLVLDGLNLSIKTGEILAVTGLNGSGKSTLLKAIFNKVPKTGTIHFNGRDISLLPDYKLVDLGISYMLQGGLIFPSLSVAQHLALATQHLDKNKQPEQQEKAYSRFNLLADQRKQRAGNLSGGQRQLLSLGMLLAQGGTLWLMDEPTAGLDPETVALTIDFLKEMNSKNSISLLLVEHNHLVTKQLSHIITVLKDGILN